MSWICLILFIFSIILCYYIFRFFIESFSLQNLNHRAVLITGCDTGFGRLLAIKCVNRGIPTFAGCLTSDGTESLEMELCNSPLLKTLLIDVTSDESVQNAVHYVRNNLSTKESIFLHAFGDALL